MNWKSTQNNELPPPGKEVVISVNGVNYISVFQADKNLFKVEGEMMDTSFRVEDHVIYWSEFPEQ